MSSSQFKDPVLLNDWHVLGHSVDLREGAIGKWLKQLGSSFGAA